MLYDRIDLLKRVYIPTIRPSGGYGESLIKDARHRRVRPLSSKRRGGVSAARAKEGFQPFFASLAQESLRVMVRLKTSRPCVASGSTQK